MASTLKSAGLVDRMIVKLNPVVFGSGIPLFNGDAGQAALELKETKVYDCGIVLLRYDVCHPAGAA